MARQFQQGGIATLLIDLLMTEEEKRDRTNPAACRWRRSPVIEMNQQAYRLLGGPKQLMIIPSATHRLKEPGMLEQVAESALKWFRQHFARPD